MKKVLHPHKEKASDFQKFLLNGPVMDDNHYNEYLENKKQFDAWRAK